MAKISLNNISRFVPKTHYALPLYLSSVSAGFPSPAEDYIESELDLNEHLIAHPVATFFLKVAGDSMIEAGIHEGDTLIVDRSLTPQSGKIVIAALEGQLTVKRLSRKQDKVFLLAENKNYAPIDITNREDVQIWGVVTTVLHYV